MNKENIYEFTCKYIGTSIQVNMKNIDNLLKEGDKILKGEIDNKNFKIKCVINEGKYFRDVLSTYFPPYVLISEKLKNLLIENNFTGWKLYNVDIYTKKNILTDEKYYLLGIFGRSGKINYKNRIIIEKQHYENGPFEKRFIGYNIDMSKWDGSDFFLPENNLGIRITQRVFDVLKKNKISNLSMENIQEIEIPIHFEQL